MTDDQPESNQEPSPLPEEPVEQERPQEAQQPAGPEPAPEGEGRSREDALAEVRQSLRDEEQAKKPGFFARLRGLFRRRKEEPEVAAEELEPIPEIPELRLEKPARPRPPVKVEGEAPTEARPEAGPPAPVAEQPPAEPPAPVFTPMGVGPREEEAPPEPPKSSILKTLHEEGTEEKPVDYAAIRGEALEGYAEQPEEPVEETSVSMQRTMRRAWRDMRPIERASITTAVVVIIVAVVFGLGYLVAKATGLLPAPPVPTSTPSDLPYPISISLPGGWDFNLRKGVVQGSPPKWEPTGPEWLEGTELCRWVSLPYSVQLEAVLRTLKANDEITLTMSNYDKLIYKVKSREQVPADQIQGLQTPEPCLLVILSNPDSDQRWVVVSNP